ncbi:hypothetical protein [Kosmotoga sp. DU53]|jgi:hypothetical protein|uniref:hypothetical protein n=1 Tax=Kosmotoga sp. DU53 TaxID=1310160 RepID=UPI0007C55174|nr:hypothetical protein [Kosmotoga sp. DU53]MDK2954460.1 hypothetical protein [Kosmotoga sp.]OAA21632.1 hypothetical protein DU53_05675 [Kosmotoga sp. DU53]
MMESSIRRALSDADIRPLIEFINKSNFSKGLNYLSPFVYKQVFNDLYIREKFFNYSIYVYSEFVDGKIHKVSYYQLPSPGSFSKSADLVLFASRNRPSKAEEFLVDSIHNLSQAHPVISKVKVNLKIEKNVTGQKELTDLLRKSGFTKEIVLEGEFYTADLVVYSYFLG